MPFLQVSFFCALDHSAIHPRDEIEFAKQSLRALWTYANIVNNLNAVWNIIIIIIIIIIDLPRTRT